MRIAVGTLVAAATMVAGAGWAGTATASTAEVVAPPPATAPSSAGVVGTGPGPQLSIAVDDGRTSTTDGDALTYAVVVRNLGSSAIDALQVSQTMPAGLTFVSADAGGARKADTVSWSVDLGASAETTVHTTMNVSSTPPDLLRMASVACAATTSDGRPVVCASDSDLLPAGAQAEAARQSPASTDADVSNPRPPWLLGVGILVIIVLAGGLVVLLTRRRRTDSADLP